MEMTHLIEKYNVQGPRYTSYPTVPNWKNDTLDHEAWLKIVEQQFIDSNNRNGISLYIHLPYCESLCTYCGCNTRITVNHKVETPYIQSVINEWKIYKKRLKQIPQIKDLHLGGGTPTFFSPKNLQMLILNLLNDCKIHRDAEFSFEAHPGNTTKDHLLVLFDLNFRRLSLGIQDFDPIVQDTINRYQTFEDVKRVTEKAREIGYKSINFDLIFGLPKQTFEGIVDTVKKVIELKPDRIAYYSYAHVPWLKPGQRKFTEADLPVGETKRKLYDIGKKMLLDAGYKEIGMDHFALEHDALYVAYTNNKLHRNFMGYTDKYSQVLIGLGVSSISEVENAYMQNIKTIEAYQTEISKKSLAIYKGIILTEADKLRKNIILELNCKLKTEIPEHLQSSELTKKIQHMEIDGIVSMQSNTLIINDKAKGFTRNVCMLFDEYLNNSNNFSSTV
jgi:oxygen-independent coproporphyrinogen III oxidase